MLLAVVGLTVLPPSVAFVSSGPKWTHGTTTSTALLLSRRAGPGAARMAAEAAVDLPRMQWRPEGWRTWEWDGLKVNYVAEGEDKPGTPLVLIHGFGASAFHWRHNIPALAQQRPVYALDLIGFGLSDKPLLDYNAELWRDQVGAFLREVVGRECVLAGNSLGGFTALYATSANTEMVKGCVLLNAAGRFKDPANPDADEDAPKDLLAGVVEAAKKAVTKAVIFGSFFVTKQPARIEQVLKQVYAVDPSNVDAELVESIRFPADTSPNCPEVFYRVISRNGSGPKAAIDDLLPKLTEASVPLLLLWGEQDPWIRPAAADKIQALKPDTRRVSLQAGHCPHDEVPGEVNRALEQFALEVEAA